MVVDVVDPVFGELGDQVGSFITYKNVVFCGNERSVEIHIHYEDEPVVSQLQRDAYEALTQGWDKIQHKVAAAILHYYNHEEKFSYGPEDEEEEKQWWPDIENEEDLVKYCRLSAIVISEEYLIESQKDRGIIKKSNGCFHLTRKFRNLGLTEYRHSMRYDRNGQRRMKRKLVWTEQGREFLRELIEN